MTPDNKYFLLLYSKAYNKVGEWQRKMDKRKYGTPEWHIAEAYRNHYSDLCLWLTANSPSALGFYALKSIDIRDDKP